jgi:hypothetical protein
MVVFVLRVLRTSGGTIARQRDRAAYLAREFRLESLTGGV